MSAEREAREALARYRDNDGIDQTDTDALAAFVEHVLSSDRLAAHDARVRREALSEAADAIGVYIGDEDSEWWNGYRQGQRRSLLTVSELAEAGESS